MNSGRFQWKKIVPFCKIIKGENNDSVYQENHCCLQRYCPHARSSSSFRKYIRSVNDLTEEDRDILLK
jgi:hypothetical protein